jgi:hypothetical protein
VQWSRKPTQNLPPMAPYSFKYATLPPGDEGDTSFDEGFDSQGKYLGLTSETLCSSAYNLLSESLQPKKSRIETLTRFSIFLVVACSVFDVLCLLYLVARTRLDQRPATPAFDDLPVRSSYIGLEKLYSSKKINSSTLSPIINLPHFVGHIDSSQPDHHFPLWTQMWT